MTISEQKQKTIDENDQLYNNIKILGWTLITKGYTIYLYNDKHKIQSNFNTQYCWIHKLYHTKSYTWIIWSYEDKAFLISLKIEKRILKLIKYLARLTYYMKCVCLNSNKKLNLFCVLFFWKFWKYVRQVLKLTALVYRQCLPYFFFFVTAIQRTPI